MGPFFDVTQQYGELAYTAVTHSSAGTADTVITLSTDKRLVTIVSNLNVEVMVTKNGANFAHIPATSAVSFDLGTNNFCYAKGTVFGVYHRGTAPTTSGRIGITAQ